MCILGKERKAFPLDQKFQQILKREFVALWKMYRYWWGYITRNTHVIWTMRSVDFFSPHSTACVLSDHCEMVNVSWSMLLKSFHDDWCSWVHSVSHEYHNILNHPLWLHIYMDFACSNPEKVHLCTYSCFIMLNYFLWDKPPPCPLWL